MEDKTQQGQNMYAIIFTIIAILALIGLVLLLFWRVQADNTNQNVNLTAEPEIVNVSIYDRESGGDTLLADFAAPATYNDYVGLDTLERGNDDVSIEYTAVDANGCTTIDEGLNDATIASTAGQNVQYSMYNVGTTLGCLSGDGNRDNDNCYIPDVVPNVSLNSPSEVFLDGNTCAGVTDPDYSASLHSAEADLDAVTNFSEFVYHTDPGAMEVTITLTDDSDQSNVAVVPWTLNATNSLDVTSDVDYGVQVVGALPSTTAQPITFTNTSNSNISADVVAVDFVGHGDDVSTDLECDAGGSLNIPADFVELGDTGFVHEYEDGVDDADSTANLAIPPSVPGSYLFGGAGLDKATSPAGVAAGDNSVILGDSSGATVDSEYTAELQIYVQDAGLTSQVDGTCRNTIQFTASGV